MEWIAAAVLAVVVVVPVPVPELVVGVIPQEFNCDSVGFR